MDENTYPIAFILMPNKLQQTYTQSLDLVKEMCASNVVQLRFDYLHTDCEMALINAIRHVLPETEIRLCRFHVVDAIRRQADTLGLRPVIKNNVNFKTFYDRAKQVFFFPTTLWSCVWELITNDLNEATLGMEAVQEILGYFVSICVDFFNSIVHSFNHSFDHSFNHSFDHSFNHSFYHSFIHSFYHSFIHFIIHSFIRSFIHSYDHSFIRSFIHMIIHSYDHSFI